MFEFEKTIRVYKTRVNMEKANSYIVGRISGIMAAICQGDPCDTDHCYANEEVYRIEDDGSHTPVSETLSVLTCEDFYEKFKKVVEAHYGKLGIVKFDVGNKKE